MWQHIRLEELPHIIANLNKDLMDTSMKLRFPSLSFSWGVPLHRMVTLYMIEHGLVIEVLENTVIASTKRSSTCSSCGICKPGKAENEMLVEVVNLCGAKYGDIVNIELSDKYFLKSVFIMYGIPFVALLLGFFCGAYLSNFLGLNDYDGLISFFVGIILMIISFFFINFSKKKINKKKFLPQATSIVSRS